MALQGGGGGGSHGDGYAGRAGVVRGHGAPSQGPSARLAAVRISRLCPRSQVKEARRVQENKELADELLAKQEAEAAERAKAQAEADALAAAELERVIQEEATDEGDGWGWGGADTDAAGERPAHACSQCAACPAPPRPLRHSRARLSSEQLLAPTVRRQQAAQLRARARRAALSKQ